MDTLSPNKSSALQNNSSHTKEDRILEDFSLDPKEIAIEVLSSTKCTLGFRLENSQRHCVPRIDRCPKSCTNTGLAQLCFTAPQALIWANSVTYRNIYCALCNHDRSISFVCGFAAVLGEHTRGSISLSLLFDVNPDHGVVIRSMEVKCKENNHVIPGGIQCGQVVCPVGYIQTGRGCSNEQVEFETNVTSQFHTVIDAMTSCTQTNNSDILIVGLRTVFILYWIEISMFSR